MHIKEFAALCGVSIRTLHYYDQIGLLKPSAVDRQTGYRSYGEDALLRMQQILFFRELDFPLQQIRQILDAPGYDRNQALEEQKRLLILKKQRLERLIDAIDGATKGENVMKAFENRDYENYKEEVQQRWGKTDAYREYREKTDGDTRQQQRAKAEGLDGIIAEFAGCMQNGHGADSPGAQALVQKLRSHITDHYYRCTVQILASLGQMYTADERFRSNMDKHGIGTAEFISQAIGIYCGKA